ncbi:transglutaminase-like domain-containing protein [Clostridium sp. MSJ-8]|uniref:transglutaminase-like domain-containing protein n=1 Tax=Clostridium sp. MSJ-8 TaxID=2841510 RepID=UPI001C0F349C|nr:transglutaminase-like domain-containing protein [Clostridium sp. MSJ-8]MBU5488067.1 transglutaminase-like domain-containing protein [Clostridium sp. MSJ-8]
MRKCIDVISKNIIALIFTILGISLTYYSIVADIKISQAIFMIVLITLFFVCYDIMNHNKSYRVIIFSITSIIVMLSSYFIIKILGSGNEASYMMWLFKAESELSYETYYEIGTIILLSYIFGAMYYYFTVKIIRMPILMLLSFVTLILYFRGPYAQDNIFVYLYIIFYFLLYMKKSDFIEEYLRDKIRIKNSLKLVIPIIVIMTIIARILPNTNVFPNIEPLNGLKDYLQDYRTQYSLQDGMIEDNTSKSITESMPGNQDYVLYSYKGEYIPYLVNHVFDYFDTSNNTWVESERNSDKNSFIATSGVEKQTLIEQLLISLKRYDNIPQEVREGLQLNNSDNKKVMSIKSESYSLKNMLHPENVTMAYLDDNEEAMLRVNENNRLFKGINEKFLPSEYVTIGYIEDAPEGNSAEDYFMKYFTKDRYEDLISSIASEDESYAQQLTESMEEVYSDYTSLSKDTSQDIYNLAAKITQSKESIYDKASAIVDYFNSGKYTYSLSIDNTSARDYLSYFLFDSKKGYCVQYATAMTIMCRTLNIPARYVEGYAVSLEKDRVTDDYYNVNAERAHAFVEVYIPGYGWKIFDPTPVRVDVEENNSNGFSFNIPYINKIIYIVSGVAGLIAIGYILYRLTERYRRIHRLSQLPSKEYMLGLIDDSIEEMNKLGLKLLKEETLMNYAIRTENDIPYDLKQIIEWYYGVAYGMKPMKKEYIKKAIEVNDNIYKYVKKQKNGKSKKH